MLSDIYLLGVEPAAQSTAPWDFYERIATVAGQQALRRVIDATLRLGGADGCSIMPII